MRIFISDEAADLPTLVAGLARDARDSGAALERVKALNPHLSDTQKLGAGSVLILPETAELKPGAGESAGGDSLAGLGTRLNTGLRNAESSATRGFEALAADHAAVREVLKSAAGKRLVAENPQLEKQLAAAEANFNAQKKLATAARKQLEDGAEIVAAEFAKLQKLLG